MINGINQRKYTNKINFNKPNLINSSLSSLSSESKSIPGDRIKLSNLILLNENLGQRKKITNKKPELIKIKNLIDLNCNNTNIPNWRYNNKIKQKKFENQNLLGNNHNNNHNNNLLINLSDNKRERIDNFNKNNYNIKNINIQNPIIPRNKNTIFKRRDYINDINYSTRPFNNYILTNSGSLVNKTVNKNPYSNQRGNYLYTSENSSSRTKKIQHQREKENLEEIRKLSNLLLEKEIYINEKDLNIKTLEKENHILKEKISKLKEVVKNYDQNFNFSFISDINQESNLINLNTQNNNLNNININIENNDESHILTEQTLIELKNDFNDDFTDEISNENRFQIDRFSNFRFLSDRLDDTENLNEINICENYFVDRSIINLNNANNTDNNIEVIQNNFEITNHNSPMTTLTNFHNFSERTINIEEMTYEELIDLQDRIGYVNKGLTLEEIKKIKVVKYNKPLRDSLLHIHKEKTIHIYNNNNILINENLQSLQFEEKCTICQYDFNENELIRELGCYHKFHLECLDTWLTQKKNCPNCNEEINVNRVK